MVYIASAQNTGTTGSGTTSGGPGTTPRIQNVGKWVEQETEVPVRGLMGIAMADTGNGYAVGDVDVIFGRTGVLRKRAGDPLWRPIPPSAFSPPLNIALTSWAQDVYAIPNSGVAFISWRDDYRSLIYKTVNYGQSWFNVSPLNPILYGTRFAISFRDNREGMIVGEGPGRAHRTLDGGIVWTNHSIASNEPFTDVKFSGTYWNVIGGENTYFRYNVISDKWFDFSFKNAQEFFPTHLKFTFIDDDHAYASGYNNKSSNHILGTTDGGRSWHPIPQQPPFGTNAEGHKGIYFFDRAKGWAASNHNEFAYTADGGYSWTMYPPQLLGGKTYRPVNKMIFLNEAVGWAVGGVQRTSGYLSVSDGWIFKWEGTMYPDISTTAADVFFDTLSCGDFVDLEIPIINSGSGTLTIPPAGATLSHPEFSVVQPTLPLIIPPGMSKSITIRWQPVPGYFGPTPAGAELQLRSNDDPHSPWRIKLNGLRRVSHLVHPFALTFPRSCTGDLSVAVLKTSTNGNFPSVIRDLQVYSDRGELVLVNHAIGDTLRSPDSLVFHYRSTKSGAFSGGITIESGFATCPEKTNLSFSGQAVSSELKPQPSVLVIGDVCVGASVTQHVGLENVGTEKAHIVSVERVSGSTDITLSADSGLTAIVGGQIVAPVRFTPSQPDTAIISTVFRVISGPCLDTAEVIVRARGVSTVVRMQPDSLLRIGVVPLGKPASTSFLLENLAAMDAEVTSITVVPPVPGLSLSLPSFPLEIASLGKLSVPVTWTPTSSDSLLARIRIITAQPCPDTLTLLLELVSDEMPLIVVQDALIFPTQTCDDAVLDSLRVGNEGHQPLRIDRLDLAGSNPADFRVVGPPLPLIIPPGGHAYIYLSYKADRNTVASALLRIGHNDISKGRESVVQLNARRKVQTLTVEGDTLSPVTGCVGTVPVRRLVLKNLNSDALQLLRIEQLAGSPAATLSHPPVPRSIEPYDSVIVEIRAAAANKDLYDVVLRITTDPCFEQRTLTLKAGVWTPRLRIDPDPVAFGIRSQLDASALPVTFHNDDTVAMLISAVQLNVPNASMSLRHSVSYPFLLAADSSFQVSVELNSVKDTGRVLASLCAILSAPCADTVCAAVTAEFRPGSLLLSPSPLQCVLAHCDTVRCDTIIVHNPLTVPQRVKASVSPVDVFSIPVGMEEFTLLPGASVALSVCARLEGVDLASGLLALDASEGYATVPLNAVRDAGTLALSDTLDGGNIPYCETTRVVELSVANPGLLSISISAAAVSAGTWTLLTPLPVTVLPGASRELRLRFTPVRRGEADAATLRLTVRSRTCVREQVVQLRGRHGSAYLETVPTSLVFANVNLGTQQTRQLQLLNLNMGGLRLRDIRSNNDRFTVSMSLPRNVDSAGSVSLPVTFAPIALGNAFATLCLIFDRPCPDTLCVHLEGTSVEGVLRFDPLSMGFDTLLQCQSDTTIARMSNTGTVPITLRSSNIAGPGAGAYSVLNPISSDEILQPGLAREFRIRFAPASEADGTVEATLFIASDAPLQPVTELRLSGERRTQMTSGSVSLDLGQVIQGAAITRTVTVGNTGSATVRIGGAAGPAGWSLSTAVPYLIPAGQNGAVDLRIVPQQGGSMRDTIRLLLGPCGGVYEVIVTGNAVQRFIVTDLHLGTLPFCRSAEGLVTLRNNSGAPARIDSLRITGSHASRFSILSAPALPLWLAPASEQQLTLRCTPLADDRGGIFATLEVHAEVEGAGVQFASTVQAEILSSTLDAPNVVDAGAAPLGDATLPQALVLRNNTAWPHRFDGIAHATARLRIDGALAVTAQPGDSIVLQLRAYPDMPGVLYDTLILRYIEPCAALDTIIVRSEGTGDVLPLRFSIGTYSGAPGDTVAIALVMDRDISGFPVGDWTAGIGFNPSMLYPLDLVTTGTISSTMTTSFDWQRGEGVVSMHATGAPSASAGNILIIVRCLVLIGNDIQTPLEPRSVDFAHPVLQARDIGIGGFTLDGYCLDEGRRLVRERAGFWLGQSAPNPASSSVLLPFNLDTEAQTTLKLYDANGREAGVVVEGILPAGRHEYRFDVRALPAGYYRCVLTSGAHMLSRGLSIVK
ncbi:MAG: choice-of-anchor D domain-containing protein [Bacteroidia bacterium]|nr:choice-of-anchor D domain-containing protein [Bacteroidia bacterium]